MKICMIGMGSIGSRHIKNISLILKNRNISVTIDALRHYTRKLSEDIDKYINTEYYDIAKLPNDYDVIFITNPTNLHYDSILKTVSKTKHMFIEKPLFMEKGVDIRNLKLSENGIYYVACPLRFKPTIRYVKKLLDEGERFVSVRATSSSYLPMWRKGIDYRINYSAKKELSGGVAFDLIHEWDYLTYLFGFPQKINKYEGKYSDLEIDSDDIAVYIAQYTNMLVEVHLDYCGINSIRTLELIGNRKRILVDLVADTVTTYSQGSSQIIELGGEDFYISEMEYFFDLLDGKKDNINSIENAAKLLEYI